MKSATSVRIVPFAPHHASAFKQLNYAWIERYFAVEAADTKVLEHPETEILAAGGQILMAEAEGDVIGTCALLRADTTTMELAKMAVAEPWQGHGVGRALGEAIVAAARASGARRVTLETNRKLGPALALYRKLGFRQIEIEDSEYTRCDVQMALTLDSAT